MEYTEKILYQSNYWYNDGLRRAKIRDLSGAVTSLKKSLQFNTTNIAARNLLGLVYYGRGEVGEALVEWILSKNLKSHENIANYYIQKLQEDPAQLQAVNQAIQKFNQSLQYCYQNGEDLAIIQLKKAIAAHPSFLKAYQLLTLLYIHTEQYSKAKQVIRSAHKLDKTNDITLHYMHELQSIRRTAPRGQVRDEESQTVSYHVGNDTIIQPISAGGREHKGRTALTNILLGAAAGAAVMWFLIVPAVNKSTTVNTNKQAIEFSDKIAAQEAQISALKTELESYRATSEETESARQTAKSTLSSYEIVMSMYEHYKNEDMSDAAMVGELVNVDEDALGVLGKEVYETITSEVYERYAKVLYKDASDNYNMGNYTKSIEDLTLLMQMEEGYESGEAMYLLSKAYEASGDAENAKVWSDKVEKKYPMAMEEKASSEDDEESE